MMCDDFDPDIASGLEKEVGYFNMVDGTDEKAGYEEKVSSLRST